MTTALATENNLEVRNKITKIEMDRGDGAEPFVETDRAESSTLIYMFLGSDMDGKLVMWAEKTPPVNFEWKFDTTFVRRNGELYLPISGDDHVLVHAKLRISGEVLEGNDPGSFKKLMGQFASRNDAETLGLWFEKSDDPRIGLTIHLERRGDLIEHISYYHVPTDWPFACYPW